jgi:hypothetical protein
MKVTTSTLGAFGLVLFVECCMNLMELVTKTFPWWIHSPNSGVNHC